MLADGLVTLTSSSPTACRPHVAGGAEAATDVVVDHTDILHERVHAGGPDESEALRFELLGEGLRLRCRRWKFGNRSRCSLTVVFVRLRECHEAWRRG